MSTKIPEMKIVLLGEVAVGKTSTALQYVRGEFREFLEATIGASYMAKVVNVGDSRVKVSIWDTAGQETYHSLAPLYYRSAAACIVVFDVSRPETFAQAKEWVKELQQKGPADVVLAIAANKCDLVADFDLKSMREYADDIGAMFARTSAKTGEGIEDLFQELVKKCVQKHGIPTTKKENWRLVERDKPPQKKSKCC